MIPSTESETFNFSSPKQITNRTNYFGCDSLKKKDFVLFKALRIFKQGVCYHVRIEKRMPTFLKKSAIEASQQLALRFGIEDVTTNYGFSKTAENECSSDRNQDVI